MSTDIPIVDFAKAASSPEQLANDLLTACTDWGFFFVENHPIPQKDIDGIFDLQQRFFAQSLAEKLQAPYIPAKNSGYKPASSYGANGKFTDPREAISINKWPTAVHGDNAPLPPILSEARPQIRAFQQQVQSFTRQLLELISLALHLPSKTFVQHHDATIENFDNFELMHYPPVTTTSKANTDTGVPAFRISPHTDWGTLTLLFQSTVGGLEVRPPHYTTPTPSLSTETWTPAPALPDKILINIGDMLEFWTAGKLKSTWHRVVPTEREGSLDRYTFAYFLHPDRDCVLVPMEGMNDGKEGWTPRYEGVGRTAEQHIHARIRAVHGGKKEEGTKNESVVGGSVPTGPPAVAVQA